MDAVERDPSTMASAVKHLHAFAREVNLTPAEWIRGIEFMTAAGKMCNVTFRGIYKRSGIEVAIMVLDKTRNRSARNFWC